MYRPGMISLNPLFDFSQPGGVLLGVHDDLHESLAINEIAFL